ncbi:MAG TPA: hypothetical protein GX510_06100 [Firmicutes bacterium]|nr:hypothetical protein [Candidatus Fermentithermobacillaceae bacterium]
MVRVTAVTPYPMSRLLLERYVGGILKGMAQVKSCGREEFVPSDCDIAVAYAESPTQRLLTRQYRDLKVIGIRFTIQAKAVRALSQLGPGTLVGVVADHHECANMLLREILDSGVFEPRFISGAFSDMKSMPVEIFTVAEEMDAVLWTKYQGPREKVMVLPRSLSPSSVGEIISAVVQLQTEAS